MVALASIDVIIEMIKKAPDAETARKSLCETTYGQPLMLPILLC